MPICRPTTSAVEESARESLKGVTYIKLFGVSPDDFDLSDDRDEAYRFASAVHDLAREEFGLSVTGVATVVNDERHELLRSAELVADWKADTDSEASSECRT